MPDNDQNKDDKMEMAVTENGEVIAIKSAAEMSMENIRRSISKTKKSSEEEEGGSALWLITFTDAMALMLTFFVMLYAMSVPAEDDWEDIRDSTKRYFGKYESPDWYQGPQDTIDIAKLDFTRALNLNYLSSIIADLRARDESLKNILLYPQQNHLVISLPQDLLFKSGQAEVSDEGKTALFLIGGSLSKIRNRIEVIGHTDPRPITNSENSQIDTNWDLSLLRAMAVSDILQNVGYTRKIITRGLASSRFDELPTEWEEETRLNIARRVDILVMQDDGSTRQYMEFANNN